MVTSYCGIFVLFSISLNLFDYSLIGSKWCTTSCFYVSCANYLDVSSGVLNLY